MPRLLFTTLFVATFAASTATAAAGQGTTLAVVDFYNLSQSERWKWLGKGLADMLITDLSVVPGLTVLDREDLKRYERELALQSSGLVDTTALLRLGQTARVQRILFGVYIISADNQISIRATLIDIASEEAVQVESIAGSVEDLFELEDKLALNLIRTLGITLQPHQRQALRFTPTKDLDSAAHFYTALDHYDRGEVEQALSEARLATRIDPGYLAARFWVGRLYTELAEYRHAVLALGKLYETADRVEYRLHSGMLLAQVYAKHLDMPDAAVTVLEPYRTNRSRSLQETNLRFRLAQLYYQTGAFDKAYTIFHSLSRGEAQRRYPHQHRLPYKSIKLLPGRDIKKISDGRYYRAFLNAFYYTDRPASPSPVMFQLSPETPTYSRTETLTSGYFSMEVFDLMPMFYTPRGLKFQAVTLEFQGPQKTVTMALEVHGAKDFRTIWTQPSLPKPVDGRASYRYDFTQERVRAVYVRPSIQGKPGDRFTWRVRAEFMPEDVFRPGGISQWRQILAENVVFPVVLDTPGHNGYGVSLQADRHGRLFVAYDDHKRIHKEGGDGDLWLAHSRDGTTWMGPQRLSTVNSVVDDFSPHLSLDGLNRHVLTFVSNRRGADEIWIAISLDGLNWQRPHRVHVTEEHTKKQISDIASPKLFQDQAGQFRLGFYHKRSKTVMFTSSPDLLEWTPPLTLRLETEKKWNDEVTLDYFQDKSGVYRLVVSPTFSYSMRMLLGTSFDGTEWSLTRAAFDGDSYPSVIHDQRGQFVLLLSSDGHGLRYIRQHTSTDWKTWSQPEILHRIHYFADTYMAPSDIAQDQQGVYWIAVHHGANQQLQVYRLASIPTTRVRDTFVLKPDAHHYARGELGRLATVLEAQETRYKEKRKARLSAR